MSYGTRKKDLSYYIRMFISAVFAVLIVGVISQFTGWPADDFFTTVELLFHIPFLVVIFLFVFNFIASKFIKPDEQKEKEQEFLMRTSKRVRDELQYDKEKFKELQEDEKFQTFYRDVFEVYRFGEKDGKTIESLENRFGEGELAKEASDIVIDETKKLIDEKKTEPSKQPEDKS